jgi:hypothetical protein
LLVRQSDLDVPLQWPGPFGPGCHLESRNEFPLKPAGFAACPLGGGQESYVKAVGLKAANPHDPTTKRASIVEFHNLPSRFPHGHTAQNDGAGRGVNVPCDERDG